MRGVFPIDRWSCALGKRIALLALWPVLVMATAALGQVFPQEADLIDRPISAIHLQGLSRVPQQEVLNNLRAAVGNPFDPAVVKGDVARLTRLGQFKNVDAIAELQNDGSVAVTYRFVEQEMISEVQVVGNKLISDQDLLAVVRLVPKGPRDDFLIQNAKRSIEKLYRDRGHYLTTVTVDETELKNGLLIFRVDEGPRVKIKAVEFMGNKAFTEAQLYPQIKTRTAMFLFRKGQLDEEQLADDEASLDRFYRDHGYIDVRVGRQIDLSPDNTEAKVTFLIYEGQQYTIRKIQVGTVDGKPLKVFAAEQIAAILELKVGDVYQRDLLRKSVSAIQEAFGLMGYLAAEEDRQFYHLQDWKVFIHPTVLKVGDVPQVDLLLEIAEGKPYNVGLVEIQGNSITRDPVIRRELRGITPGRPFDGNGIETSQDNLTRTRLFNDARITVQREDPADPTYRDVLVEVKERNTGSVNFGVAVGSDSGLFGDFSLNQNNFDITDTPESFDELFSGRSFRGGGQSFSIVFRPGVDLFQFGSTWTEPHLFDSDYSLSVGGQYRTRVYDVYNENRFGGTTRIGRQFGDIWNIALSARAEEVKLTNIQSDAPTEDFEDAGPNTTTALGISLTRTTINSIRRPGNGSRLEFSFDQAGALGGAFHYSAVGGEYTVYYTLSEDFLGRISTIKLSSRVGYEFGGDAPTYEKFYLGGRSFRGFQFRTISPKGIRADNGQPSDQPVGGQWLFFAGAQYEFPIFADAMTGVLFVDSGTVTNNAGFDAYRVSVGAGIRLYIPQFGQVPIAFDFGFPIVKLNTDQEQLFSFSAELPF